MDAKLKGDASEVLSTIFGSSTQGLSLFSNNAFRRQTTAIPEEVHMELNRAKKASPRVPEEQAASASVKILESEQIRVPETEEDDGYISPKKKKKKRQIIVQAPLEPLSPKKNKLGRSLEKLDNSFDSDTALRVRLKQQEDSVEPVIAQTANQGGGRDCLHELKQRRSEVTSTEKKAKHGKRVFQDVFEPHKPMKRQKTNSEDASMHTLAQGSLNRQTADHIQSEGGLKKAKTGTKRKKEDSLEARYEKKLRGLDDSLTAREESQPTSATKEEEKIEGGTNSQTKKRKRVEGDENFTEAAAPRTFDADEKLKRTIFVGNLPLTVKKKAIIKEFSTYGPVESVRLRSVPLLDTKIPRKGAIITGQINEAVESQHAYVVFKSSSDANDALAHNMKEFSGNHVRVDVAYAPHGAGKGKTSLHYDHRRSLFVGNIPFDVKDEELYKTFGVGKSPELDIEAVRVVRDPQTSLSKGIAYVLFKTEAGASSFLSPKRKVKLRDRILRISRVLASQSVQKQPSPSKHARKLEDTHTNQLQRKRAKLSASYEGVRARKEPVKERQKATSRSSGRQHVNGSGKVRPKGPASIAGTKRKRVEKKQRGISRSKKIRRT